MVYKFLSGSLLKAREKILALKKERTSIYLSKAKYEFDNLIYNPLFVFGVVAYWGEGNKVNGSRVSFANSDPNMVEIVVKFYRECLKIADDKLRVELFIYENLNENEIKKFWSNKLNLPLDQFIKVQILKSRSKLTKRSLSYGVCAVYFSSTEYFVKMVEWIRLLGFRMRE